MSSTEQLLCPVKYNHSRGIARRSGTPVTTGARRRGLRHHQGFETTEATDNDDHLPLRVSAEDDRS